MSASITQIILGESNYIPWSKQIRSKVIASGTWDFIDSPPSKPTLPTARAASDGVSALPGPTAADHREQREWSKSNGIALGLILESLSDANHRLVATCTGAKDAWDKLKEAHTSSKPSAQFLLFQELSLVRQTPGESLTAYHSRILLAADALSSSFPGTATVGDVIGMLSTFLSLTQLEESDANEAFVTSVTISGVTTSTLPALYASEQTRRNTSDKGKEAGLAASSGGRSSGAKASSPKCSHCSKAHASGDCWKTFPEKMPEWLRVKKAEDRAKSHKAAPAAAARVDVVSDGDSSDEEVAYAMATRGPRRL